MSTIEDTVRRDAPARNWDPLGKQIRDNVQALLIAWGMTQKELANRIGMPYSTLNKRMRGVHQTWYGGDLARLYRVFGADRLLFQGLEEAARTSRAIRPGSGSTVLVKEG